MNRDAIGAIAERRGAVEVIAPTELVEDSSAIERVAPQRLISLPPTQVCSRS